jgi:putative SOS response-associated peptidase YedK
MCSAFTLETNRKQIEETLGSFTGIFLDKIDTRFTVGQFIPVFTSDKEGLKSSEMKFGLIPAWSDTPRPKFATHNARLFGEDGTPIFKKATWKAPFSKRHGFVPMTEFIEPIYTGEFAGKMVRISADRPLFAASIWESWLNKETGELIESTSILTDDPIDFVKQVGHDRTPVYLTSEAAIEWTKLSLDPTEMIAFLRENRFDSQKWKVKVDREMKDGWQKRIPKGI